jgi:hypothetical protein
MNKEYKIVMNDEIATKVSEILHSWAEECRVLGFADGTAAIIHVATQIDSEREKFARQS